jgi:hypothetical protein
MSTVKTKQMVTTVLAIFALLAGLFAFSVPVEARGMTQVRVPSGDVDALYDAVYDESGLSRDNVTIFLEPGQYALDTNSRPFGGRLVLGENTSLASTLRMAADDDGVPLVDDNFQPTILQEGAVIVGWGLALDPFGEGVIEVGYKGRVEGLTVVGGIRPGVEITSQGTVTGVYSWGHSMGFRVRAAVPDARGTLKGNLSTENSVGISILTNEHKRFNGGVSDAVVRARVVLHNAFVGNFAFNFALFGGMGTNNNQFHVTASGNEFRGRDPESENIVVVGGGDFLSPGGNNNSLKLVLDGNLIADGQFGLKITGGSLQKNKNYIDLTIPSEERKSSNNRVVVHISDATFQGYEGPDTYAISAVGSYADPDAVPPYKGPGGDYNTVSVTVDGGPLRQEVENCIRPEDFERLEEFECTSEASIRYE